MGKYYLHEKIGTVCMCIEPDHYTSAAVAGQFNASDNDTGVPVKNADHILFIAMFGDATDGAAPVLGLAYSSTGSASDAGNNTDVWASSDAYFTAVTSDTENEVYLLDLDLGGKSLTDDCGVVYVVSTAVAGGEFDFAVLGIPYGMRYLPSTNENTVVYIGETST